MSAENKSAYTLPDMESLGIRVKQARLAAKLSQAELAEKVGIKQPSIQAIESGKAAGTKYLLEISQALGVTPEWLSTGTVATRAGISNRKEEGLTAKIGSEPSNVGALTQLTQPSLGDWINVLGATEGGPNGSFLWNGEIVDRIPRPPSLMNATNGYGLFVSGSSMSPRYEAGETVHVHPGRPVTIGCYVVVQVRNPAGEPPLAFLKRLVRRTAKTLYLEQLAPRKTIEIPSEDVISIHRVVGSGEN